MKLINKTLANENLSGILFMLMAMLSFATMDAMAKYLVKDRYDPVQILAIRSVLILTVMLTYYIVRRQLHRIVPKKPIALAIRGAIGFVAPYCFFKSLQVLPLADATVIFFSSTLMITALSVPILKEPVGFYRWAAVILGFVGVLIAMDVQGSSSLVSYGYCLLGSFAYSLLFLSGRLLAKTETVDALVFSFNLSLLVIASLISPLIWVAVPSADLIPISIFAVLALVGHFCVTTAFSKANVAVIAPFEYTALIWAVLWGYLIWDDIPDARVIVGGAIIISCAIFIVLREAYIGRTNTMKDVIE